MQYVYSVEEVIDLGNHVLQICSTSAKAHAKIKNIIIDNLNVFEIVEYEIDSNMNYGKVIHTTAKKIDL